MDIIKDIAIPVLTTILSVGASWWASRRYYLKAGKELRDEAARLRQLNVTILAAQLNRHNPDIQPVLDKDGIPVGLIVPATGGA
jgi:hypothetical protein